MTNHWIDIQHANVIMIIGSNAAENHPVSFKWVTKAVEDGATLISVDPRFTRTSAKAHIYAPLRSGTDIAFIGGMINYILQNNLYHADYVREYTNASFLINPKFGFKDGVFTGYDAKKGAYNKATWQYQKDADGMIKKDPTLKDPNCVFQLLKKHFSRYDVDTVCNITGTPKDVYMKVAKAYAATGDPKKSATIMYAMGTTQHTYGTQNIRSYAIMQLLLGNIGRAGGGINALRGESNVQGSTDHCLLFHILPGYLSCPTEADVDLKTYMNNNYLGKNKDPKSADWWSNAPKYMASLCKAFYGDAAMPANDFGYQWLPKRGGNYSHISTFEDMYDGKIQGLFLFGQNPAVAGPNARKERKAMENLDWMVAIDLWETETSVFWKAPDVDPKKIKTEVFRLPVAASMEKEGSIVNSGRWAQWRYKAVNPPGKAMDDLWIIDQLAKRIKKLYAKGGAFPAPIQNLYWNYDDPHGHPDVHKVAKEINGYFLKDMTVKGKNFKKGDMVPSFAFLQNDGSTSSGNWLYCASYTNAGNMMARRDKSDPGGMGNYHKWSWCWPVNRRIIYNRASVDIKGKPWNPAKPVIAWNATTKKWEGDVPDGGWAPGSKYAFIMKPEGHARLFGMGRADGPFPEVYEPMESPLAKNLMSKQKNNPAVYVYAAKEFGGPDKFPIVATTYRVTEHWQAGAMTRYLTWLGELMPNMFVEMSATLAASKGIKNGDLVKVWNSRGSLVAVACVTERFRALKVDGKMIEQVGLPWHWGFCGVCSGDSANELTPHVGDANTRIPEYKTFLVDVAKV